MWRFVNRFSEAILIKFLFIIIIIIIIIIYLFIYLFIFSIISRGKYMNWTLWLV